MKFTGKVTAISAEQRGTSKAGKEWRRIDVVLEYEAHEKYPKQVLFSVMNDNIDKLALVVGESYEVEIDFSVNAYNGKHYMNASCWKASALSQTQTPPPPLPEAQQTVTATADFGNDADDNLPF